jgi:ketosteroid isomerase-like protein
MDQLQSAIEAFDNAIREGDLHKASEMYAEDATFLPPNSEMIRGNQAITAYWTRPIEW